MNENINGTCYCCNAAITDANTAVEHIFPNALGGKLKSRTILCSDCNGKLGKEVDSPFCQQMGFVVSRLDIKREKGEPPAIKAKLVESGDPIIIRSDKTTFAPRTRIQQTENGYLVSCDQKNLDQAKKTLSRKAPNLQFTRTEPFESDVQFRLESDFGGTACYRAVSKIAVGYFMHIGGAEKNVGEIISFVKNGGENVFVILYYPTFNVFPQRSVGQIAHAVAIRGDPIQKLLYAYVELFTAFRFLITLSHNYVGDSVNCSYCFDLRQGCEVKAEAKFYESRTTIADKASSTHYLEALKTQMQALFAGDLTIDFS